MFLACHRLVSNLSLAGLAQKGLDEASVADLERSLKRSAAKHVPDEAMFLLLTETREYLNARQAEGGSHDHVTKSLHEQMVRVAFVLVITRVLARGG